VKFSGSKSIGNKDVVFDQIWLSALVTGIKYV
jgi:frataxin-like iron-binding protein CyaY